MSEGTTYTGCVTPHANQTGSAGRAVGLRVVTAATADALACDLAATFTGDSAPGPLERCVVAVQGPGLGRWLRGDMARRLGAWGGVETPFLRGFLLELACQGTTDRPPRGREDLDELAFRVASVLSSAARGEGPLSRDDLKPALAMVRPAGGNVDHASLLRVARRLADAFDRCQVDRPELIEAWQAGRSGLAADAPRRLHELEAWQRPLWKATAEATPTHRAWSRLRGWVAGMERGELPGPLPAFVGVFGVSLLSPFLVRALSAMSRHTQVTVHMLAPTQAFVAERATRRQLLWKAAEAGADQAEVERALHMPAGHPLLDAMGRQASQAQRVLLDLNIDLHVEVDEPPEATCMLHRLHRDLLLDQPPTPGVAHADGSVQVHAVSTAHRAAEVAHDAVLAAMSDMPGLRPERVAILTPDIVGVGGAVESVFAERGVLPLTAADRRLARASSLAVALRQALAAAADGLDMACVQATLGQPGVLARLRLRPDDLARWLDRLEEAGARRFLDRRDRASRLDRDEAPDDRIHTLQWAVDRVVLGLAMQGGPDRLDLAELGQVSPSVDPDVVPSAAAGSAGLQELHEVVQAIEALADFARASDDPRPLHEWCERLLQLADRLLPAVEHADFGRERLQVEQGLRRLADAARKGGFLEPLDLASAREPLEAAVADAREGTHFASGGVTLARLAPMRSVPFDLLVLVGLDLGAFPRGGQADSLDPVAASPRAGDQVPRQEDLQLFLECVHAARRRLVVVHRGVDARTSDRRPPSPVVDQLLDACADEARGPDERKRLREALVTVHPQRCDQPEAWPEDRPVGFDATARDRAEAADRGRTNPTARDFMNGAVIEPRMPDSAHAWMKALRDPAEALLERLGLRVPDTEALLSESDELVDPGPLQAWKRRESCARAVFRGHGAEAWMRAMRLQGWLPHGRVGTDLARVTLQEVVDAHKALTQLATKQGWLKAENLRTAPFDHAIALRGRTLAVQVERLVETPVQVLWYPSQGRHHMIAAWVRHLLWSVIEPGSHSVLMPLGRRTPRLHATVEPGRATARLERLTDFAIAAGCVPLPIDPKVIMACDPDASDRDRRVRNAVLGAYGSRGVMHDAASALVFADERWGPGRQVRVGAATVPTGLDDLAAELRAAMKEDGWLTK